MNTESQHNANSANNIAPASATGNNNKYNFSVPHRSNTTYIFIPFTIDGVTLPKDEDFSYYLSELKSKLDNNQYMVDPEDAPRYLYRYVIEKMMPVSDKPRSLHYIVNPAIFDGTKYSSPHNTYKFRYPRKTPYTNLMVEFPVQFDSIQLYCFSTSVCILVFQVFLPENNDLEGTPSDFMDPMVFSERQFFLKNVYQNDIYPKAKTDPVDAFSFLSLSKKILNDILDKPYTLFYYTPGATQDGKGIDLADNSSADSSTVLSTNKSADTSNNSASGKRRNPIYFQPRANILSYLEVPSKGPDAPIIDEYEKELHYLRHCYANTYTYYKDPEKSRRETYCNTREICWGFTPEAAICLACAEKQAPKSTFIEKIFYKNFNRNYLLMYVMLLHQKYAIYMFLTKVNAGIDKAKGTTELIQYQEDVRRFEMEFMYTHITEVPQYQELYEKIWAVFSIDDIFTDVLEPLEKLNESRRQEEEKYRNEAADQRHKEEQQRQINEDRRRNYERQQQEENDKMNSALFILSLLGVISALVDGYDLLGSILRGDWGVRDIISICIQYAFLAAILIICGRMLWKLRKKK